MTEIVCVRFLQSTVTLHRGGPTPDYSSEDAGDNPPNNGRGQGGIQGSGRGDAPRLGFADRRRRPQLQAQVDANTRILPNASRSVRPADLGLCGRRLLIVCVDEVDKRIGVFRRYRAHKPGRRQVILSRKHNAPEVSELAPQTLSAPSWSIEFAGNRKNRYPDAGKVDLKGRE
jgi:hypothetical protein